MVRWMDRRLGFHDLRERGAMVLVVDLEVGEEEAVDGGVASLEERRWTKERDS